MGNPILPKPDFAFFRGVNRAKTGGLFDSEFEYFKFLQ